MVDSIKDQRRKVADLIETDPSIAEEMVSRLEGSSRRDRQNAAAVLSIVASRNPEVLSSHIGAFVDALKRPEAQTRWECLDALTALVDIDSRACERAISGAEGALFDEGSGPLHLSALRFLCRIGSTTSTRSQKVWPLIDEALQCYHGDFEYQDMLAAVVGFAEGKIDDSVKDALKARMEFDANNGKGALKKRSQQIVEALS